VPCDCSCGGKEKQEAGADAFFWITFEVRKRYGGSHGQSNTVTGVKSILFWGTSGSRSPMMVPASESPRRHPSHDTREGCGRRLPQ